MPSADNPNKNGGRLSFLLLVASLAVLNILHRTHGIFRKDDSFASTSARTTKGKGASAKKSDDFFENAVSARSRREILKEPSIVKDEEASERRFQKPSNITIYVIDPSSRSASSMDYASFASVWDRGTTYEDILQRATSPTTSDKNNNDDDEVDKELRRKLAGRNSTVIFHTSPKTASSTLRNACLQTQYDTCDLPHKRPGMKWPDGYKKSKRLVQLFGECPETRHFCLSQTNRVNEGYARHYGNRTFLHAFPFREYDEWAGSALHQIYYRDGEEGCREEDGLLDRCLPHKYELDFEKYTKPIMANFMHAYRRLRVSKKEGLEDDRHVLLVYRYDALHETLAWLNDAYGVPLLQGTDASINSARPDESCEDEEGMLKKFHDCFSGRLAGLRFDRYENRGKAKEG